MFKQFVHQKGWALAFATFVASTQYLSMPSNLGYHAFKPPSRMMFCPVT